MFIKNSNITRTHIITRHTLSSVVTLSDTLSITGAGSAEFKLYLCLDVRLENEHRVIEIFLVIHFLLTVEVDDRVTEEFNYYVQLNDNMKFVVPNHPCRAGLDINPHTITTEAIPRPVLNHQRRQAGWRRLFTFPTNT